MCVGGGGGGGLMSARHTFWQGSGKGILILSNLGLFFFLFGMFRKTPERELNASSSTRAQLLVSSGIKILLSRESEGVGWEKLADL